MKKMRYSYLEQKGILMLVMACLWIFPVHASGFMSGKVVDCFTGTPLKGTCVTSKEEVTFTDENGIFVLKPTAHPLVFKALGHRRAEVSVPPLPFQSPPLVRLFPFTPKGLYLSFYGIGYKALRESALNLIKETELNSLVIDVKGDRGRVACPALGHFPQAGDRIGRSR